MADFFAQQGASQPTSQPVRDFFAAQPEQQQTAPAEAPAKPKDFFAPRATPLATSESTKSFLQSVEQMPLELFKGLGRGGAEFSRAINILGGYAVKDIAQFASLGRSGTEAAGKTTAAAWNEKMVKPWSEALHSGAYDSSHDARLPEKLANMTGGVAMTVAESILSGGESGAAALGSAVKPVVQRVAARAAATIRTMSIPSAISAVNTGHDVYKATGDAEKAAKAAVGAYGAMTVSGAVPAAIRGPAVARISSGMLTGMASALASHEVSNRTLPPSMRQPMTAEDLYSAALLGGLLSAAHGGEPAKGGTENAAEKRVQPRDYFGEHPSGDQGGQAAEAGGGDRTVAGTPQQEGQPQKEAQQQGVRPQAAAQPIAPEKLPPFPSENELRQQQHEAGVRADAEKLGLTPEQTKAIAEKYAPKPITDPLTGYQGRHDREATLQRAVDYVKQNPNVPAHYVAMDISNLGGLNAALSETGADKVYKAFTGIAREEMDKIGAKTHMFRHGGDEVSAVMVGGTREQLAQAADNIRTRIQQYVRENNLQGIKHTKMESLFRRRAPGTGMHLAATDIAPGDTVEDVMKEAHTKLELEKKGVPDVYLRLPKAAQPTRPAGQVREGVSPVPGAEPAGGAAASRAEPPGAPAESAAPGILSRAWSNLTEHVPEAVKLGDELQALKGAREADMVVMKQMQLRLQEQGVTNADIEAIAANVEDPRVQLTPRQQEIKAREIDPIRQELGHTPGYWPRHAAGKGNVITRAAERLKGVVGARGAGGTNVLRKTFSGQKHYTMVALEDALGNRTVVSRKPLSGKRVELTAWKDNKPEPLGVFRERSIQDLENRETAVARRQLRKAKTELATLTRTAAREQASTKRIANLRKEIPALEKEIADVKAKYAGRDPEEKVIVKRAPRGEMEDEQFKLARATRREVEANTSIQYHPAIASLVESYIDQRAAQRAAEFVDSVKNEPWFQSTAAPPGRNGEPDETAPRNWRTVSLQTFRGWKFAPKVATTIDTYWRRYHPEGRKAQDSLEALNYATKVQRAVFFITPWIHEFNITMNSAVNRGLVGLVRTGLDPVVRRNFTDAWVRARKEVGEYGPTYQRLLAKGVPFQAARVFTKDLHDLTLTALADGLDKNPTVLSRVQDALGVPGERIVAAIRKTGIGNQESLWRYGDFAILHAIFERQNQGMSEDAAIQDAMKYLYGYRGALHSKAVNALTHPAFTWFGSYHYDNLRIWGNIAKDVVKGNRQQRLEGLDKVAMHALMLTVVYPLIDHTLRSVMGKDAELARFGSDSLPYNVYRLTTGQMSYAAFVASQISLSPNVQLAMELHSGRDTWTGRPLWQPGASGLDKTLGVLKAVSGTLYPVENVMQGGLPRLAEGTVGIHEKPAPRDSRDRRAQRKERRERK